MLDQIIRFILLFLLVFTPTFFGSVEPWAFSLMELAILLIIVLGVFDIVCHPSKNNLKVPRGLNVSFLFLSLFLLLIVFQMISIPAGVIKIVSPRTFALRNSLSLEQSELSFPLSFVPFFTQIEFFKWLTLSGLFIFLLHWRLPNHRITKDLVPVIMGVGITESLYGIFEYFSGHRHILYLDGSSFVSSVTGTFINRNYFAGYLLMVIPLSLGYLFSRKSCQSRRLTGWRNQLSSLDGKTLLTAFGIIVMILGLLFSASRMGILSLLLSFSLIKLLVRDSQGRQKFSKTILMVLSLALLWGAWIGLDAVIGRFFNVTEDFQLRWGIWENALDILRDFPLLGSGLGTFALIFTKYQSFHVPELVTHAENDFLQLASEVGLVGIGILLILFSFLFYKAITGIRSLPQDATQKYIGIGGFVGILALMLHSLAERNIQVPANAFLFTFIWAFILRIGTAIKDDALAGKGKVNPFDHVHCLGT